MIFFEPEKLFFAKPCLSEFHESSTEKIEPDFFLYSQASMILLRLVRIFFLSLKSCFSSQVS